jgi:CYTH domain-containing protein
MTPAWQKHKYSLVERERRFLLETLPEDLSLETFRFIEDLYFPDTRLRLRKITNKTGETLELKLTQKFGAEQDKGEERVITNMYLNKNEYVLFSDLAGHSLNKRRYNYSFQHQKYAVDVFEGHLSGLVLAEIECDERTMPALPTFAVKDVTDEIFFTGGNLAMLSQEAFRAGLQNYL